MALLDNCQEICRRHFPLCVTMADAKPIYEIRFDAAVRVIQSLPRNGPFQPSNDMMLKFYSYYKQATLGPCNIPRPSFWDPVGKVKWDAWNCLGDMPREKAMMAYVEEMKLILETVPVTEHVVELLEVLGPFYEISDDRDGASEKPDHPTGFGNVLTSPPKSVPENGDRCAKVNNEGDISDKDDEEEEEEDEDDEVVEEEEEEEKEDAKDMERENEVSMVRLKVEDPMGKSQLPISNGSVEHSIPSMANGTHSSLNSECMEEELACSLQPPEQTCDVNGHNSDHNEEALGPVHLASDSDGEVYCDSMEQFGQEEVRGQQEARGQQRALCGTVPVAVGEGSGVLINHSLETGEVSHPSEVEQGLLGEAVGRDDPQGGANGVQHGGEDGTPSGNLDQGGRLTTGRRDTSLVRRGRGRRSPGSESGVGARGGLLGGGGDGERWGSEGGVEGTLNEQIATALARLQEDMQSVLQRLQTLEALTASQTRSLSLQQNYPPHTVNKKLPWWPFDISPGTVAFTVVWPFVVHWLVHLGLQRRRRKMN